jgi:leader peptidase (prepilin peptidase)/N-methyltransferase
VTPRVLAVEPVWVVVAALVGLASGPVVPPLVARLPEPTPTARGDQDTVDPAGDGGAARVEDTAQPTTTYRDVAARPGLARRVSLAGAVVGVLLGATVPAPWPLVLWLALLPVGLLLAAVDARTHLLPRVVVLPATAFALLVVGAVELTVGDPAAAVRALVAGLVLRSVFWVLWFVRRAGMGFGDVRLAALVGVLLGQLGWAELVAGAYAGFLLLGIAGLARAVVLRDRRSLRREMPFGPALLAGTALGPLLAAWFAGLAAG